MNRSARSSNAKGINRISALVTAVTANALLVASGCGIPQLRYAVPGPALPEGFHTPTNVEYFSGGTGSPGPAGVTHLVNYVNAVSQPPMGGTDDSVGTTEMRDRSMEIAPNEFHPESIGPGVSNAENSSQIGFLEYFNDPVLTGLIEQALVGNQELNILAEEIRIACNEVQARQGEYLPFATIGAGAGVDKPGVFTRAGAVEEQLEIAPGRGFPDPLPDFLVATNISWQIDIWRKLRNAKDAAALRFLATQEGRTYVVTRLVAEIADEYYQLLALDNRLTTLDQTIQIQQHSLEVAQAMKDAGRGTELAVQRFQAEVRKNQSEKLIIHQEIIEVENRINFLAGRFPQQVERNRREYLDLYLPAIASGVPSELLVNRADIREAERQVAAAGLDVQVARARFYPSLSLNAGVGYQAFNPRYLFWTPESLIYNAVGELVAPLVNKAAIKADYRTANAKQLQAIYNYQRTVINAYTEVVNQMTKIDNYGKSIEIKKQQLAALVASVDAATGLFQNARAEYVDVLLAQREMMETRMVLIETKRQQLSAVVSAYQALGGGSIVQDFPCPLLFGHDAACNVDCVYPEVLLTQ
ncbi:MAG: efflux transporter outer membrane subunit [Planctomycetales bacterium]|nr:efflux transporter outer membrane subunit [Planctomycetales bacterium]